MFMFCSMSQAYEVERQGVDVVVHLLAESIGQPAEPLHRHPHREVMPLDMGRADMAMIGFADYGGESRGLILAPHPH
jgi:hypothetical protein